MNIVQSRNLNFAPLRKFLNLMPTWATCSLPSFPLISFRFSMLSRPSSACKGFFRTADRKMNHHSRRRGRQSSPLAHPPWPPSPPPSSCAGDPHCHPEKERSRASRRNHRLDLVIIEQAHPHPALGPVPLPSTLPGLGGERSGTAIIMEMMI